MDKRQKAEKITWIVTIGLLVVFFVISIVQLVFLFGIKKKQDELENKIEEDRAYIEQKQKEIDYLKSDEYLQDWADQNGYIKE